jgi:hypothetical protein
MKFALASLISLFTVSLFQKVNDATQPDTGTGAGEREPVRLRRQFESISRDSLLWHVSHISEMEARAGFEPACKDLQSSG